MNGVLGDILSCIKGINTMVTQGRDYEIIRDPYYGLLCVLGDDGGHWYLSWLSPDHFTNMGQHAKGIINGVAINNFVNQPWASIQEQINSIYGKITIESDGITWNKVIKKCECGAEKVNGRHSTWCCKHTNE